MEKVYTLVRNDLRHIFRDKTLMSFLFAPILLLAFVRLFIPYITVQYPVLVPYHPLIMMFASIQTAVLFGFITSFLILEEKDENVLQAIRVLPLTPAYFIAYRLLFASAMSFTGALTVIRWGGLAYPGLGASMMLALQCALTAPFITLVVATFARNKIEGVAFFKGVNLLLVLPVLSFFLTGPVRYLFAVIPVFWTFHLYDAALRNASIFGLFIGGLFVYVLIITLLFRQFRVRVFNR